MPTPVRGPSSDRARDERAPVEEQEQTGPRRWRPGRIAVVTVVLGLVGLWIYVIYLAVGPGRQPPIDRLSDPTFAQAAEPRCAEALAAVEELPLASESPTATERADVLDRANRIWADAIDDIEGMVPLVRDPDERDRTEQWLADFRTFLGDRREFARALRSDPGARLLVSEKPGTGRHITGWIDEFALANRMPSCATPPDA